MSDMHQTTTTGVPVHVIEPMTEYIRCVRMAAGRIVYEFSVGGAKISRVDADVFDAALAHAREKMIDEPTMVRVEVPRAS